ncbi:hypothetical protein [Pseudomonas protegens]|uniref:hypothetical protein n=1 Tax=Pseudomonas protegens TaxID=380021 RepID=UPI001F22CC08|nr:hypothetical protein [Pseudomonas protegens]
MNVSDILQLPDNSSVKTSFLQDVVTSYDSFCDLVENRVLDVALELERNKPLYHEMGEDQLTGIFVISLKLSGLDADHDTYRNGHVDLLVKNGRYEWMGEAKLDNGPAYLMEGFRQLSDRYTDGNPTSSRGGLLIYTQKQNKTVLMDNWLAHVSENYEVPVECVERCQETLSSRTRHIHNATGIDYRIRHIAVSLYYKPTDKSARNSKAK